MEPSTMYLIATIGSGLLKMLADKPDTARSAQDRQYEKMVKYYGKLGQRAKIARSSMVALGATPGQASKAIGIQSNKDLIAKFPYQEPEGR